MVKVARPAKGRARAQQRRDELERGLAALRRELTAAIRDSDATRQAVLVRLDRAEHRLLNHGDRLDRTDGADVALADRLRALERPWWRKLLALWP